MVGIFSKKSKIFLHAFIDFFETNSRGNQDKCREIFPRVFFKNREKTLGFPYIPVGVFVTI